MVDKTYRYLLLIYVWFGKIILVCVHWSRCDTKTGKAS